MDAVHSPLAERVVLSAVLAGLLALLPLLILSLIEGLAYGTGVLEFPRSGLVSASELSAFETVIERITPRTQRRSDFTSDPASEKARRAEQQRHRFLLIAERDRLFE